jgi:hypothetical protein
LATIDGGESETSTDVPAASAAGATSNAPSIAHATAKMTGRPARNVPFDSILISTTPSIPMNGAVRRTS